MPEITARVRQRQKDQKSRAILWYRISTRICLQTPKTKQAKLQTAKSILNSPWDPASVLSVNSLTLTLLVHLPCSAYSQHHNMLSDTALLSSTIPHSTQNKYLFNDESVY